MDTVTELRYNPAPEGAEMTEAARAALDHQREVAARLKLGWERITPIMAAEWMEENAGNRPISKPVVRSYKIKLIEGRWQLSSATIAFDINDRLIDGQHRLLACIETGIPFYSVVVRGLDPDSQDVTDGNIRRNLGHQLARRNEENYATIASVVSAYWKLIRHRLHWAGGGHSTGAVKMDVDQGLELFNTDAVAFRETVSAALRANRALKIPPSLAGCLYYAFSSVDAEENEVFWEWLLSRTGMDEGNPVMVLRNKLIDNLRKSPENRITTTRMAAYIIKGWNHYINGEEVSDIRWYPGGSKKEQFPLISGFTGYLYERRSRGRRAASQKDDDGTLV